MHLRRNPLILIVATVYFLVGVGALFYAWTYYVNQISPYKDLEFNIIVTGPITDDDLSYYSKSTTVMCGLLEVRPLNVVFEDKEVLVDKVSFIEHPDKLKNTFFLESLIHKTSDSTLCRAAMDLSTARALGINPGDEVTINHVYQGEVISSSVTIDRIYNPFHQIAKSIVISENNPPFDIKVDQGIIYTKLFLRSDLESTTIDPLQRDHLLVYDYSRVGTQMANSWLMTVVAGIVLALFPVWIFILRWLRNRNSTK